MLKYERDEIAVRTQWRWPRDPWPATARANASPRSSLLLLSVGRTVTIARARTSSRDYTPDVSAAPDRSNPGTPTQPRRPDFIGVGLGPAAAAAAAAVRPSPQRRFLSEGELLRAEPAAPPAPHRPTADDIRELAAEPRLEHRVAPWPDRLPHPPRGGVAVLPPGPAPPNPHSQPSPLSRRRPPPAPAPAPRPARPLSFVRALEVQDQLEARVAVAEPPDRASVYDCNYEISVWVVPTRPLQFDFSFNVSAPSDPDSDATFDSLFPAIGQFQTKTRGRRRMTDRLERSLPSRWERRPSPRDSKDSYLRCCLLLDADSCPGDGPRVSCPCVPCDVTWRAWDCLALRKCSADSVQVRTCTGGSHVDSRRPCPVWLQFYMYVYLWVICNDK